MADETISLRHPFHSFTAIPNLIWGSWIHATFLGPPSLRVDSLFPAVASHLLEEWSCLFSELVPPFFLCKAGCPQRFGAGLTASTARPSQGTIIPHQESSWSPKWYCTVIPQSHRAVQNTHYQPTAFPCQRSENKNMIGPSLLGASSSLPAQLCLGLSTSVLQYSSHWLNCTCLLIS